MSSMFEEMKKHEDRNKVVINREADEIYQIFGFPSHVELLANSLLNKRLGALLGISTVLAESGIDLTLHLMTILTALYHIPEEEMSRAGDLLELLNSKLTDEELVKTAAMMIKTHEILRREK